MTEAANVTILAPPSMQGVREIASVRSVLRQRILVLGEIARSTHRATVHFCLARELVTTSVHRQTTVRTDLSTSESRKLPGNDSQRGFKTKRRRRNLYLKKLFTVQHSMMECSVKVTHLMLLYSTSRTKTPVPDNAWQDRLRSYSIAALHLRSEDEVHEG